MERRLQQDPHSGFRVIVDIASRQFPAIEQILHRRLALESIHRLLDRRKSTGDGTIRDDEGVYA